MMIQNMKTIMCYIKNYEIKLDCLSKSLTKTTFYGYLLKPVVFSSEILCIFLTKKVSSTKLYNSS